MSEARSRNCDICGRDHESPLCGPVCNYERRERKLKAENAELRALNRIMSDSFDKLSDECVRLRAQVARVKEWQTQVSDGHFNFDPVCPTERLKEILSSTEVPLAVVEGRVFDDPGSDEHHQFRSLDWFRQFGGSELDEFMAASEPAIKVVLSKGEGYE